MISNYLNCKTRTVTISVKDLLNWVLLSGDLCTGLKTAARSSVGIKIHRKIQKYNKKVKGYLSEYPVNYSKNYQNYKFIINGKIDGVYQNNHPQLIEEIKTTEKSLDLINESTHPYHWHQVKCYAFIYTSIHHLTEINVQLLYYNIHSQQEKLIQESYNYEMLHSFFFKILDQFIKWLDFEFQRQEIRDKSIYGLKFPFDQLRPGQDEMMMGIEQIINSAQNIFIRAPTGIGKTAATIYPSMKSIQQQKVKKIFYLTAKTITREIVLNTLELMNQQGLHMIALVITAKDKICAHHTDKCDQDNCPFAVGYYDRIKDAIWEILHRNTIIDRDKIVEYATKYQICPFEFSLDIAVWADMVIGDYNYIFDPRVYLRRFLHLKKHPFILLIDEAHNLVSRARDMYSEKIQLSQFLAIKKKFENREIKDNISSIIKCFEQLSTMTEGYNYLVQKEPFDEILHQLERLSDSLETWLISNTHHPDHSKILDLYFNVLFYIRIADNYDSNYSSYLEIRKSDMVVKQFCMDPSSILKEIVSQVHTAVFFSATLQPLPYYQQLLGGDINDQVLNLPSPFNPENLKIISINYIETIYRKRHLSYQDLAEIIKVTVQSKSGNYMVYFPSYRYLDSVYRCFTAKFPEVNTVVQKTGMSEVEREKFLLNFENQSQGSILGFAVMGGVFSESIDLIGDKLIGVIIIGTGLPQICLEINILKNHFQENQGEGFEYAYTIPGANKVMQAGGRVIRSDRDKGVIILADKRYREPIYEEILPEEWSHRIAVNNIEQLQINLDEFWH